MITEVKIARALNGMAMISLMAADFALACEGVVRWQFHPDTNYYCRFGFTDGIMTIHQYTSEDTYLLHEIGHLLSVSIDRWWRYSESRYIAVDFGFTLPKTSRGVQQLCMNEIRATAVEETLRERYHLRREGNDPFPIILRDFCERQFGALSGHVPLAWIMHHYEAEKVTFDDIMERWRALIVEMRRKAILHRFTHRLPRVS